MATKPNKPTKPRAAKAKRPGKGETALFRGSLEKAGQVQKDAGEPKAGTTHALVESPDGEVLVRRRFSAR